jgi:hypothetical protein
MTSQESLAAGMYKTLDFLSLQHTPHLALPTEVKVFGADVAAEVASLTDEEVLLVSKELDDKRKSEGRTTGSLEGVYLEFTTNPPRAYEENPEAVHTFAMRQLRSVLAERLFGMEYTERFPDRAQEGYEDTEIYKQGKILAACVLAQFLAEN